MGLGVALGVAVILLSVAQRVLIKPRKPAFIGAPRFDDLALQTGSEGSPVKRALGKEARIAGTVIWNSDPDQALDVDGNPQTYIDLAVGICEGPIAAISRIYAEDRVLFGQDVTVTIVTNDVAIYPYGSGVIVLNSPDTYSSPEVDLTVFNATNDFTISGLTSTFAVYNGTWKVDSVGSLVLDGVVGSITGIPTTFVILRDPLLPVGAPVLVPDVQTVTLVQDQQSFSVGIADSVTYYLGSPTQNPDPLIESYEGVGEVPAWRGRAYVVLENFRITEYGGRIPSMSFLVHETLSADAPVGDRIVNLLTKSGVPSELIDVSAIGGIDLQGMELDRPESVRDSLVPILQRYDLLMYEDQGSLVVRPRSRSTVDAEILESDLKARPDSSAAIPSVSSRDRITQLPTQMVINYSDPEKSYQRGTQRERWNSTKFQRTSGSGLDVSTAESEEVRNLPMVMSGTEARALASRELWISRTRNETQRGVVSPSMRRLRVGDHVRVTYPTGRTEPYLLVGRTDSDSSRMEVQLESVQPQVGAQTGAIVVPSSQPPVFVGSGYSWELHDPTNFADESIGRFWLSLTRGMVSQPFVTPQLWYSSDGTNYTMLAASLPETVSGTTFDVEPGTGSLSAPASSSYWDRESFVDVVLGQGSLVTRSEAAVIQGQNRCVIGGEVLAFRDAELIGPRSYRLRVLLRGLRGTEHEMAAHFEGERFALTSTLISLTLPQNLIGVPLFWKLAAPGQSLSTVPARQRTIFGNNRRPFAPLFLRGVRDTAENLSLSWTRRTRRVHTTLHVPTPLEEPTESYEVEIRGSASGAVVRTLSVTGQSAVTYSAFQQALDGLFQADQYVQVFQVGDWGRGLGSTQEVFS